MRTPVWASNHCIITHSAGYGTASDTKVCQLHRAVFICEDVCALDVTVNYTLIMQIDETLKDLRYVYSHKVLRELSKTFRYVMKGPIFTEPVMSEF
jgi:hypothetical protein